MWDKMDDLVLGLLALIALFGAGIVLLELTKPKRKAVSAQASAAAVSSDAALLSAGLVAVNQKIALLSEQVGRHESILARIPLDAFSERLDTAELKTRVDRLFEFKSNAEIEIVAMRDALVAKGLLKSKVPVADPLLESAIRERAFNSRRK
jgi:hypothetical protein